MHTVIESIATANPLFKRSQAELATFMARIEGVPPAVRDHIATNYAVRELIASYLGNYTHALNLEFRMQFQLGRLMHHGFIPPAIAHIGVKLCHKIPALGNAFIRATWGSSTKLFTSKRMEDLNRVAARRT